MSFNAWIEAGSTGLAAGAGVLAAAAVWPYKAGAASVSSISSVESLLAFKGLSH
jgi:hypothetical protein